MKKILAIIGSPRKVDTFKAVKRLEEEVLKIENVQFDYINLKDLDIKECLGCHKCIKKGIEQCHQFEKIKFIIDQINSSDVIILSTPVYNNHVTALIKKMFDYMTYLWHRPEFFGKKFFGVSSGGGMFGHVFKYMKENVVNWGGEWIGGLGVPHYDALTDHFKLKVDKDIVKAANRITVVLKKNQLSTPTIKRLVAFNIWKINVNVCKKEIPKDYQYWKGKGWLDMSYYYHTKISISKKVVSFIAVKAAHHFMKKVYKEY